MPTHNMTAENRQRAAEWIVREHATDVEYLSVCEMTEDDDPTDDDTEAIHGLCRSAIVTVTWPTDN